MPSLRTLCVLAAATAAFAVLTSAPAGAQGPPATPAEIVNKLAAELAAVMDLPDVRERFAAQSATANVQGPVAFAKFLDAERDKWADIVKRSGAKVD